MLKGKGIVVGVTGGIAAYKTAELVRLLMKAGAKVDVIMTEAATRFVGPLTFQALTGNPVHTDQFKLIESKDIGHISLADRADLMLVCPATANVVGKTAHGIADDLLTTTIMACKAPVVFAPAMNVNMWNSPANQANLVMLRQFGYHLVEPGSGYLACGWEGKGRLADLEAIVFACEDILAEKPLLGKRVVITAGPTREKIDPVRFLSNRSSGKMGFALARAATLMGADVTLIAGPTTVAPFPFVDTLVRVESATEMLEAVQSAFTNADALIKCAAVADYRPKAPCDKKLDKSEIPGCIELMQNDDIAKTVAVEKGDRIVVGFAAQTDDVIKRAKEKLEAKNLDFIVANDVSRTDVGFESDENEVRIFGRDGSDVPLPKASKTNLAFSILRHVFRLA